MKMSNESSKPESYLFFTIFIFHNKEIKDTKCAWFDTFQCVNIYINKPLKSKKGKILDNEWQ